MSLTSSGQISMGDIRTELGDSGSISLKEASDGTIATINTQNDSADRPDGSAPHAMTEFYSYDHDLAGTSWSVADNTGLDLADLPGQTATSNKDAQMTVSSCSSWPHLKQIEVKTVEVERNIPIQNRPHPIRMNTNMKWWVVTEDNFAEFKEKFQKANGDPLVAYVLSVKEYETLAINIAEIKRYLEQQKEIIIYYEEAVKPRKKEEVSK